MLYAWIGYLKPTAEPIPPAVEEKVSDFLAQPFIRIHAAGPLRDGSGHRAAMMIIFEHENRDAAEAFVNYSPYLADGLYEDHRLYEYANEIGQACGDREARVLTEPGAGFTSAGRPSSRRGGPAGPAPSPG
jgi:uncharacterized protein YciI